MLFIVVCRAANLLKYAHEYIQKNAQSFAFGQREVRRNDGFQVLELRGTLVQGNVRFTYAPAFF